MSNLFMHDSECQMEFKGEKADRNTGTIPRPMRYFYCHTHDTYVNEWPVAVTYHWADGTLSRFPK